MTGGGGGVVVTGRGRGGRAKIRQSGLSGTGDGGQRDAVTMGGVDDHDDYDNNYVAEIYMIEGQEARNK